MNLDKIKSKFKAKTKEKNEINENKKDKNNNRKKAIIILILFRVLTKFNTLFFFSKVLYNYLVRLLIISTILSLQTLLFLL